MGGATVRFVNRDAAVRDAFTDLVQAAGHRVQAFASIEAFWQTYEPDVPGCVVLDLDLGAAEHAKAVGRHNPCGLDGFRMSWCWSQRCAFFAKEETDLRLSLSHFRPSARICTLSGRCVGLLR